MKSMIQGSENEITELFFNDPVIVTLSLTFFFFYLLSVHEQLNFTCVQSIALYV